MHKIKNKSKIDECSTKIKNQFLNAEEIFIVSLKINKNALEKEYNLIDMNCEPKEEKHRTLNR